MRDHPQHNELTPSDPLESLLRSFGPVVPEIDRDRLMFLAGMRAAQTQPVPVAPDQRWQRIWPALSLVSTAAAIALAIMFVQRPERVVVVERQPSTPIVAPEVVPETDVPEQVASIEELLEPATTITPERNYLLRRQQMLTLGPDAMATSSIATSGSRSSPATQRELLQELYGPALTQPQAKPWWNPWLLPGDRS